MREVQDRTVATGVRGGYVWWYGAISVALFAFDRAAKWYVARAPSGTGFVSLSHHVNTQGPFSVPLPPLLLVSVGLIAAAFLVHLTVRSVERGNPAAAFGLMLMLMGGASNLLDRLFHGGVTDVFYVAGGLTFNLADLYLVLGVSVALLASGRQRRP